MTLNEIKALIKESEQTGRPIQYEGATGEWFSVFADRVYFEPTCNLRVAPPEPPKPREWWVITSSEFRPIPAEKCEKTPREMANLGYVLTREVLKEVKS